MVNDYLGSRPVEKPFYLVEYDNKIETGLNVSWIPLNSACYPEYSLLLVESAPKYSKNDEMSIFLHLPAQTPQ